MTPRSPPARPHIGINPSYFYTSHADWAEDDAWDSTSDSESPRQSSLSTTTTSAPKPVPRPSYNSSSSTLASSYTHVNAPNPSSYPPKEDIVIPNASTNRPNAASRSTSTNSTSNFNQKNGWTIVRTSAQDTSSSISNQRDQQAENDDVDVEGDMILGDLEAEPTNSVHDNDGNRSNSKSKNNQALDSIRVDVDEIVNDPLHGVRQRARRFDASPTSTRPKSQETVVKDADKAEKLLRERSIRSNRRHKFVECLSSEDVNINELRKLAWAGIPNDLRPMAWQLLLGYLPLPTPSRSTTLARKRTEYLSMVQAAFARGRDGIDQQIWHQIEIDVPRTRPGVRLWMHGATQRSLERILYVWAIRHPASGYVQGINDLVTPFFQVFLSAYISTAPSPPFQAFISDHTFNFSDTDPEMFDPSLLPSNVFDAIEADSFWCLSRLLDGIQDNYIFAQPGIQRSVKRMQELVARIDAPLSSHLEVQNVEFMQFAFRWMNCLLMREISVQNTIRMWDTYLAEGADAFSQFHLYVCSAFLVRWSEKLRRMDFQGIIMFLQSLPTQDWGDHEIEMLLSEAFVLNSIWHNAQSHFNGK